MFLDEGCRIVDGLEGVRAIPNRELVMVDNDKLGLGVFAHHTALANHDASHIDPPKDDVEDVRKAGVGVRGLERKPLLLKFFGQGDGIGAGLSLHINPLYEVVGSGVSLE